MPEENIYAKSIEARKNKSRAELEEFESELYEREREIAEREAAFPWKTEVAVEAIIAMVKDMKRGKPVAWAKFSQAAINLERNSVRAIPDEVLTLLKSERILDIEERKDTPTKRSEA